MSWTVFSRTYGSLLASLALALAGCATPRAQLLFADNFESLANWHVEAEQPGRIAVANGALDIDVPAGVTLWFRPKLAGPVRIEFEATAISQGGPNDQVSDLNVFWMASNRDGAEPVYARARSGRFADYNDLLTYYVGLGGNRNTTTRFRRYIGDPQLRPLLPEHDLAAPAVLLVPNKPQIITLIADGPHIEYRRDGMALFQLEDATPYVNGWFALRTTHSHLRIRTLRIHARTDRGHHR